MEQSTPNVNKIISETIRVVILKIKVKTQHTLKEYCFEALSSLNSEKNQERLLSKVYNIVLLVLDT